MNERTDRLRTLCIRPPVWPDGGHPEQCLHVLYKCISHPMCCPPSVRSIQHDNGVSKSGRTVSTSDFSVL